MSNLIRAKDLEKQLTNPDLRIVDTRFALTDPAQGYRDYLEHHLPAAIYFDLDKDLSSVKQKHGGRHPLPAMSEFVKKLGERGIDNSSQVVIYDDAANMYAGRMWWLLRYAGHDRVQVLDGGFSSWLEAGLAVSADLPTYPVSTFKLNLRPEMLVDVDYVRRNLENPEVLLIDARSSDRYRGENETLDLKAGHIPGALSLPFAGNLNGKFFKPVAELKERFAEYELDEAEEIIAYCGSGVSANHNMLALEEAGIQGVKLYAGSWSDWSSYDENPIATSEEP
jgi:thiosulfate/3-mercaptopyruvate sulfurtransferase